MIPKRIRQDIIIVKQEGDSVISTSKPSIVASPLTVRKDKLSELIDVVTGDVSGPLTYNAATETFSIVATDSTPAVINTVGSLTTIDWDEGGVARIELTQNTIITSQGTRSKVLIQVVQNSTGGHSLTLASNTHNLGTLPAELLISTGASVTSYIGMIYNPRTSKYDIVSTISGY